MNWRHPIFIAMSTVATLYGGAKFYRNVSIPRTDADMQYLYDNGSYVANDHAYVSFTAIGLPADARVIVAYAPPEASNETQVVTVADMSLSEWMASYGCKLRYEWDTLQGDAAWEYKWYLYTTWVKPPSVHTNGVLNCYGIAAVKDTVGVLKGTLVIEGRELTYPHGLLEGNLKDAVPHVLDAEIYEGEERLPYELEDYFDISR
jgi:hypothetical protein